MNNYENKTYTRLEVVSKTCDVCGATESRPMELQEWIKINHHCGYYSIFGDNENYTADICQKCTEKILFPFMKRTDRFK
jgi:hypothetical protein